MHQWRKRHGSAEWTWAMRVERTEVSPNQLAGMKIISLGSGSTGNSLLVRAGAAKILVDAGLSLADTLARVTSRPVAVLGDSLGSLASSAGRLHPVRARHGQPALDFLAEQPESPHFRCDAPQRAFFAAVSALSVGVHHCHDLTSGFRWFVFLSHVSPAGIE